MFLFPITKWCYDGLYTASHHESQYLVKKEMLRTSPGGKETLMKQLYQMIQSIVYSMSNSSEDIGQARLFPIHGS